MINKLLQEIKKETERAVNLHGNFNSLHEGYAVLFEEVDELWDEVRKRKTLRNKNEIYIECIQIAAMALKIIMSMDNL